MNSSVLQDPLGSLCGALGVHVDDQIDGGRGAMEKLRGVARGLLVVVSSQVRARAEGSIFSFVQSQRAYATRHQASQETTKCQSWRLCFSV